MGLALYRTYRPGSLAEVIGQEHVTDPLARALTAGRTHHAYLFSGPRGCGKTSTARIIARSLNCEQGPTAQPCGTCRSCVELAPNGPGSIDVVELDAATHRGIDDARELREKAVYAPAASRFKIYIIDEAHQLTNEAANALLKLVEEPPAHLRFIFATTEPDKIIPTIRSRTFHYGFRLVPARVLAEHLDRVCRAEGIPAEGPALAVVARAGAGSVRDSLSVLGQLLAGAGQEGLTYADAVAALGLTDSSLIDSFVAALGNGSAAQMFSVVDAVISAGHDPRRFVTDVLERLRDLIILRADPAALDSDLIDVPDDAGERMRAQAETLSLAELSRAGDLVSAGLSEIKGATAPRLQLELLCARLALPSGADEHTSLAARLDRLERVIATGAPLAEGGRRTDAAAVPVPQAKPEMADGSGQTADAPARGSQAPVAPPSPGSGATPQAPPPRPSLRTGSPSRSAPAAPTGESGRPPRAPGEGAAPARRTPPPGQQGPSPARERSGTVPAEQAAPGPAAPGVGTTPAAGDLGSIQRAWSDVLSRLAQDSRVAWTAFHGSAPLSVSSGVLAVSVPEAGHVRAIAARGHDERLRQAVIDVLGADLSIDVVHDPGTAGTAPPAPAPSGGSAATQPPGKDTPTAATAAAGTGPAGTGPGADTTPHGTTAAGATQPGGMARAVAAAGSDHPDVPDEPSADDPDLDGSGADGLALVARELGAKPIGTIDHS